MDKIIKMKRLKFRNYFKGKDDITEIYISHHTYFSLFEPLLLWINLYERLET